MLEYLDKSEDICLDWSKSNPKAIHYLSNDGEILAAVLKKLEMILTQDEFATFCVESGLFKKEETLSLIPTTHLHLSLIFQRLYTIVQFRI